MCTICAATHYVHRVSLYCHSDDVLRVMSCGSIAGTACSSESDIIQYTPQCKQSYQELRLETVTGI